MPPKVKICPVCGTKFDLSKCFIAIHPNGERSIVTNLSEFCKEHGLNRSTISLVLMGKLKSHHGFRVQRPFREHLEEKWEDFKKRNKKKTHLLD